jgi:hypothetical protein
VIIVPRFLESVKNWINLRQGPQGGPDLRQPPPEPPLIWSPLPRREDPNPCLDPRYRLTTKPERCTMPQVQANGIDIYYEVQGEGWTASVPFLRTVVQSSAPSRHRP